MQALQACGQSIRSQLLDRPDEVRHRRLYPDRWNGRELLLRSGQNDSKSPEFETQCILLYYKAGDRFILPPL